jgi:NAD+ diphosphatase
MSSPSRNTGAPLPGSFHLDSGPPSLFLPGTEPISDPGAVSFVFRGSELLLGAPDQRLPGLDVCHSLPIPDGAIQPLGTFAGVHCRTAWVSADTPAPAGFEFVKLRAVLAAEPHDILSLAGRASQLAEWARTHRFCGACASPMIILAGERCAKFTACGMLAYPRISPAMMVLVTRGEEALLARNVLSTTGMFSALAGFAEAGESIEDTVHREVEEEVGLRVHNLRYFGSQPWPFPHSLMIAFTAEYLSGEIRIDPSEIAEAGWFPRNGPLPPVPATFSIAGHLLRAWFTQLA